jgi:AbrB family looped-hinge helix DNA binding protein
MQGASTQARLTSKGRLTLPFAARARLGLTAGDHLSVILQDDDTILLTRPRVAVSTSLRGLLAKPKYFVAIAEMDAGIGAHLAAEHRPDRLS